MMIKKNCVVRNFRFDLIYSDSNLDRNFGHRNKYSNDNIINTSFMMNCVLSTAKYRTSMCIEQGEKIMYFFTPRARKYPKGTRPDRAAGFGYWKATGVDNIIGEKTNPVGYRKSLVYYQGLHKRSITTNWIMHEYRIDKNSPSRSANAAPNDMKV